MAKDIRSLSRYDESTEQTEIFYPATTTDAIAHPTKRKSLTNVISDIETHNGAYDISAANSGTTYADLAAALDSNNGGGVPQSLQKGGMSVKFVQTSDNKYVQFRYMGTATTGSPNPFLDTANWQIEKDELGYKTNEILGITSSILRQGTKQNLNNAYTVSSLKLIPIKSSKYYFHTNKPAPSNCEWRWKFYTFGISNGAWKDINYLRHTESTTNNVIEFLQDEKGVAFELACYNTVLETYVEVSLSDFDDYIIYIFNDINGYYIKTKYNEVKHVNELSIKEKTINIPDVNIMPFSCICDDDSDFVLGDRNGNTILKLNNGHIITKNFNSSYLNILQGKKVAFLGDSITWMGYYIDSLVSLAGIDDIRYGVSGATMAKQSNSDTKAFEVRYSNMTDNVDMVVVFGGTNDFGHKDGWDASYSFGSFNDFINQDFTFCAGLFRLFDGLYNKYTKKGIPVVIMTPIHHGSIIKTGSGIVTTEYPEFDYTNGIVEVQNLKTNKTFREYVDTIKQIASYYSFPILDAYLYSGLNPDLDIDNYPNGEFFIDGLHPNTKGGLVLANWMKPLMEIIYKEFYY